MKCPHCKTGIHPEEATYQLNSDVDGTWSLTKILCPECRRFSFILKSKKISGHAPLAGSVTNKEYLVWPKGIQRNPVSAFVPDTLANDFKEACLVLSDSAKASAALSRRCLQHLLREHATIKEPDGTVNNIRHGNLAEEIQQILDKGHLPSRLADNLDTIRNIGNFAAHPIKSTSTGEVVDVEPGEADWNLDVLESLFDFYLVKPQEDKRKRERLSAKLSETGKPTLKSSSE